MRREDLFWIAAMLALGVLVMWCAHRVLVGRR